MKAVRRKRVTGRFAWIGSDGWGARGLAFKDNEEEVRVCTCMNVYGRVDSVWGDVCTK